MNVDKMLSIFSVLLSFSGSIWLVKGVLKLTPDIMAKQSETYWGYNTLQLENIISQKADFVCGISLIIIAFLCQITNFVFIHDLLKIFPSYRTGVGFVCFVSFLILVIMYFINRSLMRRYRIDSKKYLSRDRLISCLKTEKLPYSIYESLLKDAEYFCNIKKNDNESPVDFLERYSNFLGVPIPANIDLSELQK